MTPAPKGKRISAALLDGVFLSPITIAAVWGAYQFRLYTLYAYVPTLLIGIYYGIFLLVKYEATPGKLIMKIQVKKTNGEKVGYKDAILRAIVMQIFSILFTVATIMLWSQVTDAEFKAMTFLDKATYLTENMPSWNNIVKILHNIWLYGSMAALFIHRESRVFHDFVADTIVVEKEEETIAEVFA